MGGGGGGRRISQIYLKYLFKSLEDLVHVPENQIISQYDECNFRLNLKHFNKFVK